LFRAAVEIVLVAVLFDLRDMAAHGSPALDLALVVFATPAHVVTAIPLEPAARVVDPDPAFAPPLGQRL